MSQSWRSFLRLQRSDRLLVVEATVLLASIWAVLKVLHFPVVHRLTHTYSRLFYSDSRTAGSASPQRIAWAIERVPGRLPMHTTCLVRALAGYAMSRRRGWLPELRIGILPQRIDDATPLRSHAWIEHEGRVLIGHIDDLRDYVPLVPHGRS